MPDLRGLSTRRAMAWLRTHGISARLRGQGTVVRQTPAPGASLPAQVFLAASR